VTVAAPVGAMRTEVAVSYPPYPGQPVPGPGGGGAPTASGPLRNVAFGMLGAGVLGAIGPFLDWGKVCVQGQCTETTSRVDDANSGFIFVLVGLAIAAAGALLAFGPRDKRPLATWGGVGAGGLGVVLVVFEWMRNDEIFEGLGQPGAPTPSLEYSIGFYLVLLGALAGLGTALAIALGKVPETAVRPGGYGSGAPGGYQPPGYGAPGGYPQPGYGGPGGYQQPGYPPGPGGAPGYGAPGACGYPSPGQQAPGGYPSPGQQAPGGYPSPGQQAPGYPNSGGYPTQPGGYPPPPGS
jgi:hypothetical protein